MAKRIRDTSYDRLLADIIHDVGEARRAAARSVNAVMTATYWLIGRRIVELEQGGSARAAYGESVLLRLSDDLTARFGRGFSSDNLELMRSFYVAYPAQQISETASRKSGSRPRPSLPAGASAAAVMRRFQLSWSHYGLLVRTRSDAARAFYEAEALRGGWTVRQLSRQIDSQFFEHTMLSRDKRTMLKSGGRATAADLARPEEEIKDPYVLEFLDLKDEYSESNVEEALIRHLELANPGVDQWKAGRLEREAIGASKPRDDGVCVDAVERLDGPPGIEVHWVARRSGRRSAWRRTPASSPEKQTAPGHPRSRLPSLEIEATGPLLASAPSGPLKAPSKPVVSSSRQRRSRA